MSMQEKAALWNQLCAKTKHDANAQHDDNANCLSVWFFWDPMCEILSTMLSQKNPFFQI